MLTLILAICLSLGPFFAYLSIALLSNRFLSGGRSRNRPICTSPGCVRCNRNANELASALDRFQTARFDTRVQYARVRSALERARRASVDDAHELFFRIKFEGVQRTIWPRAQLPSAFDAKIALLERHHAAIAEECEKALDQCPYLWARNEEKASSPFAAADNDGAASTAAASVCWFVFPLINQGEWQEKRCRECPRITALLHELATDGGGGRGDAVGTAAAEDGATQSDDVSDCSSASLLTDCLFGNVFISLLPAGAAIAEHRGLTNARLRVHIGIRVPEGKAAEHCSMTVGGEKFNWSNGSAVVIDDSFLHSVDSRACSDERMVLILDFWHPNLRPQERQCLQRIFPPICIS